MREKIKIWLQCSVEFLKAFSLNPDIVNTDEYKA